MTPDTYRRDRFFLFSSFSRIPSRGRRARNNLYRVSRVIYVDNVRMYIRVYLIDRYSTGIECLSRFEIRAFIVITTITLGIHNKGSFLRVDSETAGRKRNHCLREKTDERLNYGILYRLITPLASETGILFICPNPSPFSGNSLSIRPTRYSSEIAYAHWAFVFYQSRSIVFTRLYCARIK